MWNFGSEREKKREVKKRREEESEEAEANLYSRNSSYVSDFTDDVPVTV